MRGKKTTKKTLWRNNGLSIATFALFVVFLAAQSWVGWREENSELLEHQRSEVSYGEYLQSGSFLEVTMENWESEFLQMFVFIVFTAVLYQKGSAESKSPDEREAVDRDPRLARHKANVPAAVRRGGWLLKLYENSLSLAFLLLFIVSFALHALGGMKNYNEQLIMHGKPVLEFSEYLCSTRFWFESLQNWQSEFLAIWAMVVLSIFLRQRGSPESKPVDSPHASTGKD